MMESYFENSSWLWWAVAFLALIAWELIFQKDFRWIAVPRILWISLTLFLIADWTFIQSREISEPARMVVVYDRSDSVSEVPERKQRTLQFLKEINEWSRGSDQNVQLFSFAESLRAEKFEDPQFGGLSSLASSLETLDRLEDVVVVVLSDGIFSRQARLRQTTHSIQLGSENEKDIWIESFPAVSTAFLRNRVSIPVVLGQKGFTGNEVTVDLRQGLQVLESQTIRLTESMQTVNLSYFPDRMGEEILEMQVRPLEGELSSLNNRVSFSLRTVRDKIQILHISGKPSPDLVAWRNFLTKQPDVDLVSFYILRSIEDDPQARGPELSLIPFPYDELFTTELPKFDLVVLQNFDFNLYFQPFYLSNLARYVQEGSGLLMIGGDQSFQSYSETPLVDMFPFEFGPQQGAFQVGDFKAKVSDSHPMVTGLEDAVFPYVWTGRHEVDVREGSETLIRYEDGRPFLSLSNPGEGRIVALNTDESWRLQMEAPKDLPFAFGALARRILQYLTFDPEMEPLQIQSGKWETGKSVLISRKDNQKSDWRIRVSGEEEWALEVLDKKGVSYLVPKPGVYELWNSDLERPLFFETTEKPWNREWKNLLSQTENLESISERTGGRFLTYENRDQIFESSLRGQEILALQKSPWVLSSLWVSWSTLFIIIVLFCLDVFLRKRYRWDS
jgi:uncharacterized membrane protein